MDGFTPSAELLEKAIDNAHDKPKRKLRAPLAIAAVVVSLAILAAVPAFAAQSDTVYMAMYSVSPKIAQLYRPVQKSCTDNGIEMTVISSYVHGDTAEVYIGMRDLEGGRIDETIDLYDSERILLPFDSTCHCQLETYDKENNAATFLITISRSDKQDITGDKLTFMVDNFLSHKKKYNFVKLPYDLSKVKETAETELQYEYGSGKDTEVLKPEAGLAQFPIKGVELTGLVYYNDALHVQCAFPHIVDNDNHGEVYLKDKDGNIISYDNCKDFSSTGEWTSDRIEYQEYVFYIDREKLGKCKLYGDFTIADMITRGSWSVTFPFENQPDTEETTEAVTEVINTNRVPRDEIKKKSKLLSASPDSKKDICQMLLNTVDYYNTVSGTIKTNMLNGDDDTIDYQVDMTDFYRTYSYEHIRSDKGDFDEEYYSLNGVVEIDGGNYFEDKNHLEYIDNTGKENIRPIQPSVSKSEAGETNKNVYEKIKRSPDANSYYYRDNPTNCHYASTVSIFPQELGFQLLCDLDGWDAGELTAYEGRTAREVTGKFSGDFGKANGVATYKMLLDYKTGVILKMDWYDNNGKTVRYMRNEKINFDNVEVKTPE